MFTSASEAGMICTKAESPHAQVEKRPALLMGEHVAAGAMLHVVFDKTIPEIHRTGARESYRF